MMGHRQRLKTGAEEDAVTRWRRVLCYMRKPGVTHGIKKQMSRRDRRDAKLRLHEIGLQ
jgi:hypothetical protein